MGEQRFSAGPAKTIGLAIETKDPPHPEMGFFRPPELVS